MITHTQNVFGKTLKKHCIIRSCTESQHFFATIKAVSFNFTAVFSQASYMYLIPATRSLNFPLTLLSKFISATHVHCWPQTMSLKALNIFFKTRLRENGAWYWKLLKQPFPKWKRPSYTWHKSVIVKEVFKTVQNIWSKNWCFFIYFVIFQLQYDW